jgi:hypothetical protein
MKVSMETAVKPYDENKQWYIIYSWTLYIWKVQNDHELWGLSLLIYNKILFYAHFSVNGTCVEKNARMILFW